MGMFDWIYGWSMKCPVCDNFITGFQTKDLNNQLEYVNYKKTKNFYGYCDNCRTSIHFYKTRNRNAIGISATYKMEIFEDGELQ